MDPSAGGVNHRYDRRERIADPGIDLPGLANHNNRIAAGLQRALQLARQHPAQRVSGNRGDPLFPQPQIAQPRKHRVVRIGPDQNPQVGRAIQSVIFHVPTDPAQQFTARCGKADEVCDGRPTDEPDRAFRGKIEQFEQPARRNCFYRRSSRRHRNASAVLTPSRGQPVRRHPGDVRTAVDPGIESRRNNPAQPIAHAGVQLGNQAWCVRAVFGHRTIEAGMNFAIPGHRHRIGRRHIAPVIHRQPRGQVQSGKILIVRAHPCLPCRRAPCPLSDSDERRIPNQAVKVPRLAPRHP